MTTANTTSTIERWTPATQYLENGVLFSSPRQYLASLLDDDQSEGDIYTTEMWNAKTFDELWARMARYHVTEVKKRIRAEAKSRYNIILNGDSYKASHFLQYPPGTTEVYSYIESRGGQWDAMVVFGFQAFAKEYLTKRVTMAMVEEAAEVYAKHGVPFNREGWEYIVKSLKGRLPILIKTVKEGTVVPVKNAILTIVNTDPKCFWLTSFLETALLRAIWYPTTVATLSFEAKKVIKAALDTSSDIPDILLPSRLHDFGARGVSSEESAALGGLAHLVNFAGTDTMSALRAGRMFYKCDMAGQSIPAAEHSTITSWGKEGEVEAYRNMLRQFARPGSFVAVVSDSYDLFNAVDNIWGSELKEHVINSGATVIIRPDSGDVRTIPIETIKRLDARFGSTVNGKGYRVLNTVRVIQGDGIDSVDVIRDILAALLDAGYAADNIAFGMGGGLLQKVNRDTMKWAMKCSAIKINGEWRSVYKDPKTDPGKVSKRGRFALVHEGGWETLPLDDIKGGSNGWRDELHATFRDGELDDRRETTFDEVRGRANRGLEWALAKAA